MGFKSILKRILDKRRLDLKVYWDYNDSLTEKQIIKILLEDGLNEVENVLYDSNFDYMNNLVYEILEEELSEKEKEDKDLYEDLRLELLSSFDLNLNDLIKNSYARLRITLQTNEDFIYLPEYKKTETYKYLKDRFKGYFKVKDLNEEFESSVGSDCGHFVFFGEVKGLRILELREEILKGEITLNKNLGCGVFNNWVGAGGELGLKLKKPITLNLSDWRYTKEEQLIKSIEEGKKKSYYSVSIELDSVRYGINETYGLTSECWREI